MSKICFVPLALALLLFLGCPTTRQASSVEASGFLKDYSILHEGGDEEALLAYTNPKADLKKYDKILLEHPTLWRPEDSDMADMDEDDLKYLGTYLYTSVQKQLLTDFGMVNKPGPGVLRIRLAITEASGSFAAGDLLTTILPPAKVVSGIKQITTGAGAFVGAASLEVEITDSLSGEVLLAVVDRQVGGKSLSGQFDSWDDVEEAFEYWSGKIRKRLAMEQGRTTPE
ncbi:MAG: DUF3313 domain-containing protein [Planctomycetota bacterium]